MEEQNLRLQEAGRGEERALSGFKPSVVLGGGSPVRAGEGWLRPSSALGGKVPVLAGDGLSPGDLGQSVKADESDCTPQCQPF